MENKVMLAESGNKHQKSINFTLRIHKHTANRMTELMISFTN